VFLWPRPVSHHARQPRVLTPKVEERKNINGPGRQELRGKVGVLLWLRTAVFGLRSGSILLPIEVAVPSVWFAAYHSKSLKSLIRDPPICPDILPLDD
jgi:hypothetical protein